MCVSSIGLSVGGLSGGRSTCLPFSWSMCLWSICLCACLRAFICLSVCLFAVDRSVGRSVVFLSCQLATVCTKRAGNGGEDAESESGRLCTQARQVGLMNVELRR